ncbi:PE family protein [Williamsia sterculiae]|uniref:PE family protein n=1 Tax=Williamsia sterculiae TaxID=1344003 RepID=A0A1N7GSL7_9NOCA|nr:PE family protein [Williamsia sterculiae]SIS15575.1 PE family protein [Williamsia sterculiae]
MTQHVHVDRTHLVVAAHEMDALADHLETALGNHAPTLSVQPAGADEVSARAAETFSEVAEKYGVEGSHGVLELRKIAATLRAQAADFAAADETVAEAFRA